jgi:CDP-6-deoxy-D-xylo-4-hexulose-3-dehydrase
MTDNVPQEIKEKIQNYFDKKNQEEFSPGETRINLSEPTYGANEVIESLDSLMSTWVTMGDKVETFEKMWANYIGTDYSVMVNSGSSANLLSLKSLEGDIINQGDEVIIPAVSWSTTLFPVIDINAKPVLVDVDISTYTIDVESFKRAVSEDTAAVVLVHLLGNPCDMDPILDICSEHDIAIIEDCCEAHGAEYKGKKVGSFGDVGTFSFYFSHHISTIEGGMITTSSDQFSEQIRTQRAHGWVRDVENKKKYTKNSPDIDERFLFIRHGYNLRPTEIQGAFGLHQVDRLEQFIEIRRDNAKRMNRFLSGFDDYFHVFKEQNNSKCTWFAYPLLVKKNAPFERDELKTHLEENLIETRPILAGNLARQPAINDIEYKQEGELESANAIHNNGLLIGNHHGINQERIEYIQNTLEEFLIKNI